MNKQQNFNSINYLPEKSENTNTALNLQFQSILEYITDGIALIDSNWNYVYLNTQAAKMLGHENPEALIGKNYWTEYPEARGTPLANAYEQAMITKKPVILEDYYEPWDNWFENRIYPSHEGISIFFQNITKRKRAEIELNRKNRALMALSECNQALIKSKTEQELLNHICRVIVEVSGYRVAWVGFAGNNEGKSIVPIAKFGFEENYLNNLNLTWADTEYGQGPTGRAIRTSQTVLMRNAATDPNFKMWRESALKLGYASSIALPLISDDLVLGALSIYSTEPEGFDPEEIKLLEEMSVDLTQGIIAIRSRQEREKAQKALRESEEKIMDMNQKLEKRVEERTAQLSAANRELESFSYSVSHDLRAPLRAVSGFAEIIARRHRKDLNEEGQHYVDNIVQAGKRMGHLIDDLLNYARLGRSGVNKETVKLSEVFEWVLKNFGLKIKKIDGSIEIPDDLPAVRGDNTLITQILNNLIGNALTYHKPGVPPKISVFWQNDDDTVTLFIRDNGIGILPEHLTKVFNVIQRLHSEDEFPGTGIGLAIVKKSVELIGGSVWVESEVGKGSTFFVKFMKPADERNKV